MLISLWVRQKYKKLIMSLALLYASFYAVAYAWSIDTVYTQQIGIAKIGKYYIPYYLILGEIPISIPKIDIPTNVSFPMDITKNEASILGLYYLPVHHLFFLAPRHWKAISYAASDDGHVYLKLCGNNGCLKFHSDGGCSGCAQNDASKYLPWVKPFNVQNHNMFVGQKIVKLSNNIFVISYPYRSTLFDRNVNGIIHYVSNTKWDYYSSAWFFAPNLSHNLAITVLNFILKYDSYF